MIHYECSLLIALSAFVYAYLLTRPNKLLNGVYNKLDTYFKTDERLRNGKPLHPLFMLLIHCEQCIAGQVSLWLFLFLYAAPGYERSGAVITVFQLVFFVSHTIAAAAVITGIYKRYIEPHT
jgi:hypothetical protein